MPSANHMEIPKYPDHFFLILIEFQHRVYLKQCVIEVASGQLVQSAIDEYEAGLKQSHQVCLNHSPHLRPSLHIAQQCPQLFNAHICRLLLEVELLYEFSKTTEECQFGVVEYEFTALES
jgi:hypothetical protein